MIKRSEFLALVRQDLYAFIHRCFQTLNPTTQFAPNWHYEVLVSTLEACRRGEIKRLIANQPPRSLKTLCISVAFPAWLLGHDPSAQIIVASYSEVLANKYALDCRTIMTSRWYQALFPRTRLSAERQALQEFMTTQKGFRLATSVGGTLTGRGADYLILDDPLKPDEAVSDVQRKSVNDWFDNTLYSRLNNKQTGRIILVMQRLHEDDLVGHVVGQEPWKILRFPAVAEEDESYVIKTPYGQRCLGRRAGEALHPKREPLEVLKRIRETLGEYNFAGQYLQAPAPLGGGMVKAEWFKPYTSVDLPSKFELTFQSVDTANKPTELSNYSVITTWGAKGKNLFLLNVFRKRLGYPDLKRAVQDQFELFKPSVILIEDRASGTQLIQELIDEGLHAVKKYEPTMDKIMRMHAVTGMIENGFVYVPDSAPWLAEYLHELTTFPKSKYDDQVDSTSQALDWFKQRDKGCLGLIEFYESEKRKLDAEKPSIFDPPRKSRWEAAREISFRRWRFR